MVPRRIAHLIVFSFCYCYIFGYSYIHKIFTSGNSFSRMISFRYTSSQKSKASFMSSTNGDDLPSPIKPKIYSFVKNEPTKKRPMIGNTSSDLILRKNKLFGEIREPDTRLDAIRSILISTNDTYLSPGECKTLLVAIIFSRSESMVPLFVNRMKAQNTLTSELIFVGIRTACRRRVFLDLISNSLVRLFTLLIISPGCWNSSRTVA